MALLGNALVMEIEATDELEYDVPPHVVDAAMSIVLNPEGLTETDVYRAAAAMLTTLFESHT